MKTKEEKIFELKASEYYEKFGVEYPIFITSCLTFEEHIDKINKAIQENKPVEIEVEEVEDGMVY